jgi:TPR repeat protein
MVDTLVDNRLPPPSSNLGAKDLFRLGLGHATGQGASKDLVLAHTLFDLAVRLGSLDAQVYRKNLDCGMDPDDIAEAQSQAREWLKASGADRSQSLKWWKPTKGFAASS